MYSMYEALARERMRERQEQAARQRLCSQLISARLWRRVVAFSARQEAQSRSRLAEHSAVDYQLAA